MFGNSCCCWWASNRDLPIRKQFLYQPSHQRHFLCHLPHHTSKEHYLIENGPLKGALLKLVWVLFSNSCCWRDSNWGSLSSEAISTLIKPPAPFPLQSHIHTYIIGTLFGWIKIVSFRGRHYSLYFIVASRHLVVAHSNVCVMLFVKHCSDKDGRNWSEHLVRYDPDDPW